MSSSDPSSTSPNQLGIIVGGIVFLLLAIVLIYYFVDPFGHTLTSTREVSPDQANFALQCQEDQIHCFLIITNLRSSIHPLKVEAVRSIPTGANFTPTSITIQPATNAQIAVTFPRSLCSGGANTPQQVQMIIKESFGSSIVDGQVITTINC